MSISFTKDKKGLYFCGRIPFLPTNQVAKLVSKPHDTSHHVEYDACSVPKCKRCPLNKTEELFFEYHQCIRSNIVRVHQEVLALISKEDVCETQEPNAAPILSLDLCSICELTKHVTSIPRLPSIIKLNSLSASSDDVFGNIVCNDNAYSIVLEIMHVTFYLPPRSRFLMSDLSKLDPLIELCTQSSNKFNVVVLDPPWINKSALRSKIYRSLSPIQILGVPMSNILAPGALVMIWATNNRHVVNYIRHVMFPTWSVDYVTEWIWLKITTAGEMVCDLDSVHRKPYEVLVIGLFNIRDGDSKQIFRIPSNFIISSIPTVVHSQKPYLGPVIEHCLKGSRSLQGIVCMHETFPVHKI
jgi:N6-adenosine-specific RNA methylase IME4